MNKTVGQIIFFSSIVAIGVGTVILVKRMKSTDGGASVGGKENFDSLLVNLGNIKPSHDAVSIKFNNNQNLANFFNNNRLAIYKGKDLVDKGTYSNGGKVIKMDSGKSANGSSVYDNLETVIK